MMHAVTVRHTFEAAHRLPHIPGKCTSLHGHSWTAEVTVEAPDLAGGLVVEFGPLKNRLREWIDTHLDHGTMLGPADPLLPALRGEQCKVHTVQGWPTVENVAAMIAAQAQRILAELTRAPGARVGIVTVRETPVNEATWYA
jgi:6-pyruvoyltetrahydropterin/6-carboxytetrahydropterin synthase